MIHSSSASGQRIDRSSLTFLARGVSCAMFAMTAANASAAEIWRIDRTDKIGRHVVNVIGAPSVSESKGVKAVTFDGARDGLLLPVNPLAGWRAFTIEALIYSAPDGLPEQRFMHVQEAGSDHRVMMETRIMPDGKWCMDTALLAGENQKVLIDRTKLHPPNQWTWTALRYDGKTMEAFVNGVKEAEGTVTFSPMKAGQTSLGVRQNLVSWFKGAIREVRFHEGVVPVEKLQRLP